MVALNPPLCQFGWSARDFALPDVDGRRHRLADVRGANGLLVMFLCNHCPYVKAIQSRLARDTAELRQHGVHSVAIMSNDPREYPEDCHENMKRVAAELGSWRL